MRKHIQRNIVSYNLELHCRTASIGYTYLWISYTARFLIGTDLIRKIVIGTELIRTIVTHSM